MLSPSTGSPPYSKQNPKRADIIFHMLDWLAMLLPKTQI